MAELALAHKPKELNVLILDDSHDYRDTVRSTLATEPYLDFNYRFNIDIPNSLTEVYNDPEKLKTYHLICADYFLNKWDNPNVITGISVIQEINKTNKTCGFNLYSTNSNALKEASLDLKGELGERFDVTPKSELADNPEDKMLSDLLLKKAVQGFVFGCPSVEINAIPGPGEAPLRERFIALSHQFGLKDLCASEMQAFFNFLLSSNSKNLDSWVIGNQKFIPHTSDFKGNDHLIQTEIRLVYQYSDLVPNRIEIKSDPGKHRSSKPDDLVYTINSQDLALGENIEMVKSPAAFAIACSINANWLFEQYLENKKSLNAIFELLNKCSTETILTFSFLFYEYSVLRNGKSFTEAHEALHRFGGVKCPKILYIYYGVVDEFPQNDNEYASVTLHDLTDRQNCIEHKLLAEDMDDAGISSNRACFRLIIFKTPYAARSMRFELIPSPDFEAVVNSTILD